MTALCPDKTRVDLEWDRLLAALADRCASPLGRDLARELPFPDDHEGTRKVLREAQEATTLHRNGEPMPQADAPDVGEAVSRLRVGGVLGPEELVAVGKLLGAARTLRRFLGLRKSKAPALFDACATDPTLDDVADEILGAFEVDGTLADRASPRLKELRTEYQASRQRMLSRLDELMRKYEGIVQDRFVTEREGRYVIPIRADAHERFPGLVHSTSGSGATLFVEPRAVIPMGNRLKMLEGEVTREEIAVYTRLSGLLMDVVPSLTAAADGVAVADVRAATARLAEDLDLQFPEVVEGPRLDLRVARHPLLVLDGAQVVPSDLVLEGGRAMVISGPNAGGKTVALKTMGLAALMIRAGLPVPCAEGSTLGLFDVVLTDVGDDQSLRSNLSTFSAHVKNLVAILDETRAGALVLLDELAGGTDPREGEALAAGVLDSLCARGGAVAVTTHYEGLKALALAEDRFINASVGFDMERLKPTYRLALGVPGSSSALAVARQYGMPVTVLDRASRFLSREDQNFETVVRRMNDERAALELAREAASTREREAATAKTRLEGELAQARDREQRMLSQEAETLLAKLRRAQGDLRLAQARLRTKKVDEATAREAARAMERVAEAVALGGELEPLLLRGRGEEGRASLTAASLRKGARVYVPRLRAEAEVLEVLPDGHVRVAAGALKLLVPAAELQAPTEKPREVSPRGARGAGGRAPAGSGPTSALASPPIPEVAIQTRDNTCDLRGLRVEDGVALATSFLDRCLNDGRRVAFLVHGHGTGALRDAVRASLEGSPYVASFRAGGNGEGGDGATVVWLR